MYVDVFDRRRDPMFNKEDIDVVEWLIWWRIFAMR